MSFRTDATRAEHRGVEATAPAAKSQWGGNQPTVAIPQLAIAGYRAPPAGPGNSFTLHGEPSANGHRVVNFNLSQGRIRHS